MGIKDKFYFKRNDIVVELCRSLESDLFFKELERARIEDAWEWNIKQLISKEKQHKKIKRVCSVINVVESALVLCIIPNVGENPCEMDILDKHTN